MEESKKLEEAEMTSAAAFVEGGIQDALEDACSICLEGFCESDPSTVTGCKHEYHLQCILEWCQRSSQCPMCWQPISLKDPTSQELLDAVVEERNLRLNPPRNAAIFHHPTLGEFEIQHLPVGVNDAELEERIIQHLAAAAAMGRARHFARRGHRVRSSTQGRPQFLVFSAHPSNQTGPPASPERVQGESAPASSVATHTPLRIGDETFFGTSSSNQSVQRDAVSVSGASTLAADHASPSSNGRSPSQSSPRSQDRAGPSDLQSFSETLKSRLNAMSMRYKESLSKSTRGWKERWFSRNSSVPDAGSEVRTEVNAGIATVSGMEHLEIRDDERNNIESTSNNLESSPQSPDPGTHHVEGSLSDSEGNHLADNHTLAPSATQSGSVWI